MRLTKDSSYVSILIRPSGKNSKATKIKVYDADAGDVTALVAKALKGASEDGETADPKVDTPDGDPVTAAPASAPTAPPAPPAPPEAPAKQTGDGKKK